MSEEELIKEILKLAKTGVYRQQILDKFYGLLTQKEIKQAIAKAKIQGMYSVSDMQTFILGTYYQYDE